MIHIKTLEDTPYIHTNIHVYIYTIYYIHTNMCICIHMYLS